MNDDLLRERFRAITNPDDGSDWLDVRRRARGRGRRPLLVLLAAAVAVLLVAPAFGLHRVVVDFFEAERAPEPVQLEFSRLGIGAPPRLGPDVIPNSARRVMDVSANGKRKTLWVAPTRDGGFCFQYTNLFGSCRERTPPTGRRPRVADDLNAYVFGVTMQMTGDQLVAILSGTLLEREVARVNSYFADGPVVELPVTWVSPPIDAGFFFYEVPEEHRRRGTNLERLVALDADGDVIARQNFPLPKPGDLEHPVRLPNGELTSLPRKAIVERARRVLSIKTSTGDEVSIWVMPTTEGGVCHVWDRGGGCPPVRWKQDLPMTGGLAGGRPTLFKAEVLPTVAAVELHYEDGTVDRLSPVDGFVLAEITPAHYARGHRLVAAVALDGSNRVLRRQPYDPSFPAVYPCEKPVDIGRGVMACP